MHDPFDGPDIPGETDIETLDPPQLVQEMIGQDSQMQEAFAQRILRKRGVNPDYFTGEIDGDPRNKRAYPSEPREQVELVTDSGDDLLTEEFQMHMQSVGKPRIDSLPPEPLTPTDLKQLIDLVIESVDPIDSDYEVWVPIEPEIIDKTAVGEYRNAVPGSIIRFYLEYDGTFSIFTLLPTADSPIGFSWYYLSTRADDDSLTNGLLESEEAQGLSTLLDSDSNEVLERTPDRIRCASNLLGGMLHAEDPSPTPDGWIVTEAKHDEEKSDLFVPRFQASFVHQESDIVLEVTPLNADPVIQQNESEVTDTGLRLSVANTDPEDATHVWDLHFAPDHVEDEISEAFSPTVTGPELVDIMKAVNDAL
jgi:hypothetical protein